MRGGEVVILACLLVLVQGYGYYRNAMPNGLRIPCDSSCTGYCEGFGHVLNDGSNSCNGGGEHPNHYLSNFGNSWQLYNMTWSVGMCMTDSDGDGYSNGDEMGDPCCTWVAGATPSRTTNLANPARKDSSIAFPSCSLAGRPNVTLAMNSMTQSRAILNINWLVPSCLCGFNVSQSSPKAVPNMHAAVMTDYFSGTSQIVLGALEPQTSYTFFVTGYNMAGGTPVSISVQTLQTPATAPAPPPDLKVSNVSSNFLSVSWGVPTTNVAGGSVGSITSYELDIALENDGVYSNAYTGPNTQVTIQNLHPQTKYLLRVRAGDADGVGTSSTPVNTATLAFNGTSTSANYTSDDGAFHLGWKIEGDVITFVMTGNSLGYVAVGWGNNPTMLNTDMVVGSYSTTTGTGTVTDLWSTSRNAPAFDTQQDTKYVSGIQTTTNTTITFTRLLNTTDTKQDIPIENRMMYLVWAIGSGPVTTHSSFAVHTNRGAAQVNFFTGQAQNLNNDKLKNAHSGLAFVAWAMLIPFGSFAARYKRCDYGKWWFRIHVISQCVGALFTFIAFILIAVVKSREASPHFQSTHAICGLIMLILTFGQCVLGFVSNYMYDKNRRRVPLFPDRVHGVIGLATMLFAFITIFLGFDYNHVGLGAWLLGAQCLLFLATAVFVYELFDGANKED